jgi:acetyltransferase-like isoleucine patch superfamily enzyme
MTSAFVKHETSIVKTTNVGRGTRIWAFVNICEDVRIGENCNICDHCFIEEGVGIGNNVTIKSGAYLWSGLVIENDVMVGPNVVFTNDLRPRSKQPFKIAPIRIRKGASIGGNSTLLGGVTIGCYAMTGIASVITKDVKDYALVWGNPARQRGWVDEAGNKLVPDGPGRWKSPTSVIYVENSEGLLRRENTSNC